MAPPFNASLKNLSQYELQRIYKLQSYISMMSLIRRLAIPIYIIPTYRELIDAFEAVKSHIACIAVKKLIAWYHARDACVPRLRVVSSLGYSD